MGLGFGSDISALIYGMNNDQRDEFISFLVKIKSEGVNEKLKNGFTKFTCDDIIDSINSTIKYEKKRKEQQDAADNNTTTIPKEKWGVHITHCCSKHGCKYGDSDCPVSIELVKQKYPCESCGYDEGEF